MSRRRAFIRQVGLSGIGFALLPSPGNFLIAQGQRPVVLPRSTPEHQGIASEGVARLQNKPDNGAYITGKIVI